MFDKNTLIMEEMASLLRNVDDGWQCVERVFVCCFECEKPSKMRITKGN